MTIYVGNLSFDAEVEDLQQLFSEYGEVRKCSVPVDRETGRKRGFAFVDMANAGDETKAINDLQDVARANLIFGLHVHVGIKDKAVAIELTNQVRYFLPHILALTCSSPFWMGRNTGLKSYRCQVFKRFPRTGIPDEFSSYEEMENYVKLLVRTNCIDNGKKLWWDVRPHYQFDTVEVRICDMPTNMDHTIAVVALVQALMAKLYLMLRRNTSWRRYARALLEENKWRAVRYGTDPSSSTLASPRSSRARASRARPTRARWWGRSTTCPPSRRPPPRTSTLAATCGPSA